MINTGNKDAKDLRLDFEPGDEPLVQTIRFDQDENGQKRRRIVMSVSIHIQLNLSFFRDASFNPSI